MGRACGRSVVLLVLAGCYAPSPSTGAPCDERMQCPSTQVCVAGHCERDGTMAGDSMVPGDAALDGSVQPDALTMGWVAATPVGITVGQGKTDPSATSNRLTVVFTRNEDLFIATRAAIGGAFTITPFPFNTVDVSDQSPEISADGSTLYFASNPDGNFDVFVSTRVGNTWLQPTKVPVWSSPSNEQDVAISPDGLTAFVTLGNAMLRSTRASKTAAWSAPVNLNIAWGASPTAPSINAVGDVYYHASNPRDLFVVRRQGNVYGTPLPITDLNTVTGREAAPFISADDRRLMFERDSELVETTR